MLLSETQVKWTPSNIDKMQRRVYRIGREALIVGVNSKQWEVTLREYLPGGILSIILGKCRALVQENEIYKSPLGNWMAVKMHQNKKTIVVINLYRIPTASSNGETCSLTQYNLLEGQARSTTHYRKEIFKQIKSYLHQHQDIDDIIITGDFNQDIRSKEVKAFFREIGVKDAYSFYNNIPIDQMDKTYI